MISLSSPPVNTPLLLHQDYVTTISTPAATTPTTSVLTVNGRGKLKNVFVKGTRNDTDTITITVDGLQFSVNLNPYASTVGDAVIHMPAGSPASPTTLSYFYYGSGTAGGGSLDLEFVSSLSIQHTAGSDSVARTTTVEVIYELEG